MEEKKKLKFIFVHGLCGWGEYDLINHFMPYWGMRSGSLLKYLRKQGFECYACSVSPTGSAWDRACDLYAQLAGRRVDYGKVHSERCRHERYGKDFSKKPLIDDLEYSKLVLLGHSFGGATARLFSEILANGDPAEREGTDPEDLSPFFLGGLGDCIHTIVTLSAPNSGSTAYDMGMDKNFDAEAVEVPAKYEKIGNMVSKGTLPKFDQRDLSDYAFHDMFVDHAMELNARISTLPGTYYFAIPCSSSNLDEKGHYYPDPKITEAMFMKHSIRMSVYTGVSEKGVVFDASWQETDGLVNTISAHAPMGEPALQLRRGEHPRTGIWYNLPVHRGDHMSLQGGQTIRHKIRLFYRHLLTMIEEL